MPSWCGADMGDESVWGAMMRAVGKSLRGMALISLALFCGCGYGVLAGRPLTLAIDNQSPHVGLVPLLHGCMEKQGPSWGVLVQSGPVPEALHLLLIIEGGEETNLGVEVERGDRVRALTRRLSLAVRGELRVAGRDEVVAVRRFVGTAPYAVSGVGLEEVRRRERAAEQALGEACQAVLSWSVTWPSSTAGDGLSDGD